METPQENNQHEQENPTTPGPIESLENTTQNFPDDETGAPESTPSKEINIGWMDGIDEAIRRNLQEESLDTRPPKEMRPLDNPEETRNRAIGLRQTDKLIGTKDSGFYQDWEKMSPVEIGNALQKLSDEEYGHLLWAIESGQGRDSSQAAA